MSAGSVFNWNAEVGLTRLKNATPQTEDRMQSLVAAHPELLCAENENLLLVRREHAVPDTADGSGRWSIDHVFVTRDAVPVLVELKRAVDTRLRREVVGQMLDYAANSSAYWPQGELESQYRKRTGEAADTLLAEFIGSDDLSSFWQFAERNLRSGKLRMVFAADLVPPELERIVEFLNEQMDADVRAVELRWYESAEGALTLVPRHIGGSALVAARKQQKSPEERLSPAEWIARNIEPRGEALVMGAQHLLAIVEQAGGEILVGSGNGSLVAAFRLKNGKTAYPFSLWPAGAVSLNLKWLKVHPGPFHASEDRQALVAKLRDRGVPWTSSNPDGFPSFVVSALEKSGVAEAVKIVLALIAGQT